VSKEFLAAGARCIDVDTREGEALRLAGLVRRFGARTVLDGVDLTVSPGEVHALLGPNGAGKTTLVRVLAGLTDPSAGSVWRAGRVSLVPSGDRSLYLRLNGRENLIFFGRLNGLRLRPARARADELLEQVGLSDATTMPVRSYSHGMQKRLSVARALLVEPAILLVDEATHDLDPEGAIRIRGLVSELASDGVAVVWTTQRIEEIRGFADSVTFLAGGRVRFQGSVDALLRHAPDPSYRVRVRNGHPERLPDTAALQRALGDRALIAASAAGRDEFVLSPAREHPLGAAVVALAGAGYQVLACQRAGAEVEEAFLALAAAAAEQRATATDAVGARR
jgi:ABC-2 type transport system ATP-binding protein